MISVEEPEDGKELPQEAGVWKDRLRKRPPKENVCENPSKVKKRNQQRKIEARNNNNNLIQEEEIKRPSKNPPKSKTHIKPSQGKIGQGKENKSMSSIIQNFHPDPKTIKQRQNNQRLVKDYNRDYQDDLFESGIIETAKFRLDIVASDSDSFSSTDDSFRSRSPASSPFPRLKRESTPVWYKNFMQENQVNKEELDSYKHLAFVHKSLKNQKKVKRTKRISTQAPVAPSSKRLMKESFEVSAKEIALLSYSRAEREEEEEKCEEYFSEEDQGTE